jgi:hypothetical protein
VHLSPLLSSSTPVPLDWAEELASLDMPYCTCNWREAITSLMDGSFILEPVFSHSLFTASFIPQQAQVQFVHSVTQLLQVMLQVDMTLELHQALGALF